MNEEKGKRVKEKLKLIAEGTLLNELIFLKDR